MDMRTGISFALSFTLVAVVAVALHRPERVAVADRKSRAAEPVASARPDSQVTVPALTPGVPWPQGRDATLPPRTAGAAPVARAPLPPAPGTHLQRVSRRGPARRPRAAFTTVREGEFLADVAFRVYGSEEAKQTLWLANRDQLPSADVPLRPGSPLRTP